MVSLLVGICAALICGICIVLVFNRDYEDGLIGRLALGVISLVGFVRVCQVLESHFEMEINPVATVLWISLAVFFSRHLYRFKRALNCAEGEWRKPSPSATAGKLRKVP